MNDGLKQKALVAVLAVVALYALAVGSWFFHFDQDWKKARRKYDEERRRYQREERLIGEKNLWREAYEKEKSAMPTFDGDRQLDTTWRGGIGDLAATNRVLITRLESGAETSGGDVFEMPVTGDWEGSLDALVHFMHALENAPDGMFDIRELTVKPISGKPGYLRGTISVTCAYMRK